MPRSMTVADLIEQLEGMDPDAEVVLAQQPSWPFEYTISGVEEMSEADGNKVYIGEGRQVGYLDGEAARALGWDRGDR